MGLIHQIAPLFSALSLEREIRKKLQEEASTYQLSQEMRRHQALSPEVVKDAHRVEISRREQIQRKAQSYIVGATLAASFVIGLFALAMRAGGPDHLPTRTRIPLVAILVYLAVSALSALRVIRVGEVYDLSIQDRTDLAEADDHDERAKLIKLIHLNQAHKLMEGAWSDVSYVCMRNGVILMFLLLIALATGYGGFIIP